MAALKFGLQQPLQSTITAELRPTPRTAAQGRGLKATVTIFSSSIIASLSTLFYPLYTNRMRSTDLIPPKTNSASEVAVRAVQATREVKRLKIKYFDTVPTAT